MIIQVQLSSKRWQRQLLFIKYVPPDVIKWRDFLRPFSYYAQRGAVVKSTEYLRREHPRCSRLFQLSDYYTLTEIKPYCAALNNETCRELLASL